MTDTDTEIVSELRQQLADQVGQDRFELWFAGKTRIELGDDVLTVFVPNRFHQDWLRSHFRGDVEAALTRVASGDRAVEFRVDRKLETPKQSTANGPSSVQQSLPYVAGEEPAVTDALQAHGTDQARSTNQASSSAQASSTAPATSPAAKRRARRRFASMRDFVVGESNRVAHAATELAASDPGHATPLLIHGPSGVGKTHLAEGLWSKMRQADRGRKCVYLTAEQFTTFFLESLHGSGLPSFRRKHRGADLLIIDDVHFLAGKRATLIELLSTIDALVANSAQVVLTADRPLAQLKQLGPEFAGRISGGLVASLDLPEFKTRLGIVSNLVQQTRVAIPRDVRHYVAQHFAGSAHHLQGAMNRLHATSLAHARPVDRALAETALADLVRHQAVQIGLAEIESAICEAFNLDTETLRGGSRVKAVVQPRMLAMWLARKHTRSALSEIGEYFGRRTHSTVISAQRKVDGWMNDGDQLDLIGRNWTAREAIDELEQHLRCVS